MRIGAFQFDIRRGDVASNLAEAERGLGLACDSGLDLVLLPEMWPTSFVAPGEEERWLSETEAAVERLRELSLELDLIVCGSAFGANPGGPPWCNRLQIFDRGKERLAYDKVHLFSPTAEQLGFTAGSHPPQTIVLGDARVSGVICYDLRFSQLLRTPFLEEAEILLVPAQWPDARSSQWRALICGRAAELQAFVIGANRTGTDLVGRREMELSFPGNSILCDPGGEVLAEGKGQSGLIYSDIDLEELRDLRREVPVRSDGR